MAIVSVALVFMFSAIAMVTYSYERQKAILAMESALEGRKILAFFQNGGATVIEDLPRIDRGPAVDDEKLSSIFLIAVYDNETCRIINYDTSVSSDYSEEEITFLMKAAMDAKPDKGLVRGYNVRYLKVTDGNITRIALADRSSELSTVIFLFRLYVGATVITLFIMFFISRHMADKAIAPVEKSWEDQSRFVADASHELKTPLTVILANMDIMQANRDATIQEQNKWIENTKSEATRMTELVNDMLFLARSDAQIAQQYNFLKGNLTTLAEDCVLTFESVAFEKGMNLTSSIEQELYAVFDEARIKQVIMILIDNAIKYAGEKGSIFVSAEGHTRYIKVSVANTGKPIPAEKQSHLFERFYRVDESRVREQGGYGLGLSIAKNIIEAHGGTIGLEYSNEKGTCLSFIIPVKRGEKDDEILQRRFRSCFEHSKGQSHSGSDGRT